MGVLYPLMAVAFALKVSPVVAPTVVATAEPPELVESVKVDTPLVAMM